MLTQQQLEAMLFTNFCYGNAKQSCKFRFTYMYLETIDLKIESLICQGIRELYQKKRGV